MCIEALCYLAFYTVECTAAYKKDVPGIYMDIVLVGMFAPALWRNIDDRAFEQFEQSLLHTLSAHIACD